MELLHSFYANMTKTAMPRRSGIIITMIAILASTLFVCVTLPKDPKYINHHKQAHEHRKHLLYKWNNRLL
jgi:hypothetical protein